MKELPNWLVTLFVIRHSFAPLVSFNVRRLRCYLPVTVWRIPIRAAQP